MTHTINKQRDKLDRNQMKSSNHHCIELLIADQHCLLKENKNMIHHLLMVHKIVSIPHIGKYRILLWYFYKYLGERFLQNSQ